MVLIWHHFGTIANRFGSYWRISSSLMVPHTREDGTTRRAMWCHVVWRRGERTGTGTAAEPAPHDDIRRVHGCGVNADRDLTDAVLTDIAFPDRDLLARRNKNDLPAATTNDDDARVMTEVVSGA
jgi:hypothetical protein